MIKKQKLNKAVRLPGSYRTVSVPLETRSSSRHSYRTSLAAFFLMVLFFANTIFISTVFSQDQISLLAGDIKNCPSTYLSPDAVSYYQLTGQVLVSGNKDDALRGYRAAVKLGDLGSSATAAVPALIDQFPRAIHISLIKSARYAGEGTFEDWISTYIMNEKNKFMLSSPFMDYSGMSLCEQYIDATPQVSFIEKAPLTGTIKSATVDIAITFTVYVGSCALSRITGMTLGNTQNDWRIWWAQIGGSGVVTSTIDNAVSQKVIASGQTFNDIIVKGKYRMSLTTGDELIGFVESKDDTSLIFETTDGKPYVFSSKLIDRCDLIDLPKILQKKPVPKQTLIENSSESTPITYDDLLLKNELNILVEVKISNGSIFKGSLESINASTIKINIEGSVIPMSKEVITGITLITFTAQKKSEPERSPTLPSDTIIVKSKVVDDWGKAEPDSILTGSIVKEDNTGISFKATDGTNHLIKQDNIVRVIKHSQDNSNNQIKQYAKPLNCPQEMVLVDLPPGTEGRPYFKTCVDKFEYPNKEGSLPQGNLSYTDAQQLCAQQGKRLCTAEEWQWTCSSLDAYPYPYGKTLDENRCNSDASRILEASGARINCSSRAGAFDMVGNIFEWVTTSNNQPGLMGGPYSKCQTVSPGMGGVAKPISGLRCCKSN